MTAKEDLQKRIGKQTLELWRSWDSSRSEGSFVRTGRARPDSVSSRWVEECSRRKGLAWGSADWVPGLLGRTQFSDLGKYFSRLSFTFSHLLSRESKSTPFARYWALHAPHLALHLCIRHT